MIPSLMKTPILIIIKTRNLDCDMSEPGLFKELLNWFARYNFIIITEITSVVLGIRIY